MVQGSKLASRILAEIRRLRLSTTELADCLGKSGSMPGIERRNKGHWRAGFVYPVYAYLSSNWPTHLGLRDMPKDAFVVIDHIDCEGRSVIGALMAAYMFDHRGAAAVAASGPIRDAEEIIARNYPLWSAGVLPVGCFNTRPKQNLPADIRAQHEARYKGAIAVGDDSGVVVVSKDYIDESLLIRIRDIRIQEESWFESLRAGEDTFTIVCGADIESDER